MDQQLVLLVLVVEDKGVHNKRLDLIAIEAGES